MEKTRIKKSNIVATLLLVFYYAVFEFLFKNVRIEFQSYDLILNDVDFLLRLLGIVALSLVMIFKDKNNVSFIITVISTLLFILASPGCAFPVAAILIFVWASDRLFEINLSDKISLMRTAFTVFVILVSSALGIINHKLSNYPLVNTYIVKNYVICLIAIAVCFTISLVIFLLLSKIRADFSSVEKIIPFAFVVYFIVFSVFVYKNFGNIAVNSNLTLVISGMLLTAYNLIKKFSAEIRSFENGK